MLGYMYFYQFVFTILDDCAILLGSTKFSLCPSAPFPETVQGSESSHNTAFLSPLEDSSTMMPG